jgi:hypothetical protein
VNARARRTSGPGSQRVGHEVNESARKADDLACFASTHLEDIRRVASIDGPRLKPLEVESAYSGAEWLGLQLGEDDEVVRLAELDAGSDERRFELLLARLMSVETGKATGD